MGTGGRGSKVDERVSSSSFSTQATHGFENIQTSVFRAANLPLVLLPPLPLLAPITPPRLSAVAPGRDS